MKTIATTAARAAEIVENIAERIDRHQNWGEYGERITRKIKDGVLTVNVTMGNCRDYVLNVRDPQGIAAYAIAEATGLDREDVSRIAEKTSRGYKYIITIID
jgi:hypothetical protein